MNTTPHVPANKLDLYEKLLTRAEDQSSAPNERLSAQGAIEKLEKSHPTIRIAYIKRIAKAEAVRLAEASRQQAAAASRQYVPRHAPGETAAQAATRRAAAWGFGFGVDFLTRLAENSVADIESEIENAAHHFLHPENDENPDMTRVNPQDEDIPFDAPDFEEVLDYYVMVKGDIDEDEESKLDYGFIDKMDIPMAVLERAADNPKDAVAFVEWLIDELAGEEDEDGGDRDGDGDDGERAAA